MTTPRREQTRLLRLERVLSGRAGIIFRTSWSPAGDRLAAPCQNATVQVWNTNSGELEISLRGHTDEVNDAAWSPDGKLLASVADDTLVIVWDAQTGERLHVLKGHQDQVNAAAFSPDAKRLVTVSDEKFCALWDVTAGERVGELLGHTHPVWAARWSPSGRWLATGSDDETIRLWDLESGEQRVLRGHSSTVRALSWFPGGNRLASAGRDGTVRVWYVDFPNEHRILEGHSKLVSSVSVSRDGRYIGSKSVDDTIRIWEVRSGATAAVLHEPASDRWAPGIAFSPISDRLASLGERDTVIRIWKVQENGPAPTIPPLVDSQGARLFISYSHHDRHWLDQLVTMLKPLERSNRLSIWADHEIQTGEMWQAEIERALSESKVAILLVSPEFLASPFIYDVELPQLLDRAEKDGLRIVWIPIKESLFEEVPLGKYHAACDPSTPLDALPASEQNATLARICRKLRQLLEDEG